MMAMVLQLCNACGVYSNNFDGKARPWKTIEDARAHPNRRYRGKAKASKAPGGGGSATGSPSPPQEGDPTHT
jgi:hypothetical protein